MKKNTNKKSGMSNGGKIAIGAGVAVVGAGAYYLFGPKAKTHQKKVSSLMAKIKKEILTEIKKTKAATTPIYNNVVDTISSNYAKQYKIHEGDIKAFAKKMKSELKDVNKVVKKTIKIKKNKKGD